MNIKDVIIPMTGFKLLFSNQETRQYKQS
jgi:hypothetical protein